MGINGPISSSLFVESTFDSRRWIGGDETISGEELFVVFGVVVHIELLADTLCQQSIC